MEEKLQNLQMELKEQADLASVPDHLQLLVKHHKEPSSWQFDLQTQNASTLHKKSMLRNVSQKDLKMAIEILLKTKQSADLDYQDFNFLKPRKSSTALNEKHSFLLAATGEQLVLN